MSVTLIRETGGHDAYGDPIDTENPQEIVLKGAVIAPVAEPAIDQRGRNGLVVGLTLYDRTCTVLPTDLVVYGGETYRIDGEPQEFVSPYTQTRLRQAVLKRTEG